MRPTLIRSTLMFWIALVIVSFGASVAVWAHPSVKNDPNQLIPALTATRTRTPTRTPTATLCPMPTPEQLRVEPVTSPTNLFTQTITIGIGNGDAVTVTAESGIFTATGNFNAYSSPALVTMTLFADTTHHLLVQAHVRLVPGPGECQYGNYTLSTTVDKFGAPLTIEHMQAAQPPYAYLPLVLRSDITANCNPTPLPTETPVLPLGRPSVTHPPCPTPTITLTPFPTATPSCLGPATATAPSPLITVPRFSFPLPTCTPRPTSTPRPTTTGTPPTPVPTHTVVPP